MFRQYHVKHRSYAPDLVDKRARGIYSKGSTLLYSMAELYGSVRANVRGNQKMARSKMMIRLTTLASVFLALLLLGILPAEAGRSRSPQVTANKTILKVYNSTSTPVDVWWNSENPFATNINVRDGSRKIPVRIPSNFARGEKGVFTLNAGQTVIVDRSTGGDVLNGTITFNCIPVCPCGGASQPPCPQLPGDFPLPTKLVNGVNQCEFALNTGFESVDISCVNGSNSNTAMALEGGTPVWKNNVTNQPVSRIQNGLVDVAKKIDTNCSAVGVFPFNATDCIQTPNPPCGQPFCFHTVRDCQLDRQGNGGTVTVIITGFEVL